MAKDTNEDITIIGIGSSAGGLEAIRELVATLPTDLKVAYVVVQHMAGVGCCPAAVASLSFRPVPGVGRPEWRVLGTAASLSSRTVPAG